MSKTMGWRPFTECIDAHNRSPQRYGSTVTLPHLVWEQALVTRSALWIACVRHSETDDEIGSKGRFRDGRLFEDGVDLTKYSTSDEIDYSSVSNPRCPDWTVAGGESR